MNKIKNKIKRLKDEVRIFLKFSFKLNIFSAFIILFSKFINHDINKKGRNESKKDIKILMKKHQLVEKYILDIYKEFDSNYEYLSKREFDNKENTIWICWWQGLDNAPLIVKKCVESIQKAFKDYEVIVIDDNNYKDYIQVPKWLEDKKNNGKISKTHFSDFLRIELLAEHGGVWLDSTFYCLDKIDAKLFKKGIWSIKRPEYGHLSPACGMFANYSLGCKYDSRKFFEVLSDYLMFYWENNDYVIDYLLTDYIIKMLLNKYNEFNNLFDKIENNNKNCDELFKVLGDVYDSSKWKLLKKDTFLFKLSWKHFFDEEKDGKKTFYGMLLDDSL